MQCSRTEDHACTSTRKRPASVGIRLNEGPASRIVAEAALRLFQHPTREIESDVSRGLLEPLSNLSGPGTDLDDQIARSHPSDFNYAGSDITAKVRRQPCP